MLNVLRFIIFFIVRKTTITYDGFFHLMAMKLRLHVWHIRISKFCLHIILISNNEIDFYFRY